MGLKLPDPSPNYWRVLGASRRKLAKAIGLGIVGTLMGKSMVGSLYGVDKGVTEENAKSVQLHISIEVKAGKGPELENVFHTAYIPAIKVQDGFLSARLLRRYESDSSYEIDISFKSEKKRAAWAQSKEHQLAWPKVEAISAKISWLGFDQLA
jgi:heme-degrading monooxygenase HmoA